jgi:adenylate kinase
LKRIIVITGTPGTGKTTLCNSLLKEFGKKVKIIDVNEVVNKNKFYTEIDKDGAKIVQLNRLKNKLERIISNSKENTIILEGHLLCDMKIKNATAIIIREHLYLLYKRLNKRNYNEKKLLDDIMCEALDYCGINAAKNYNQVYEIMGNKDTLVSQAKKLLFGQKIAKKNIEILEELLPILKKNKLVI